MPSFFTPTGTCRNDPPWSAGMIVMKFGGTSVEDAAAIDRAAAIVRDRLPQSPVVIVSAMARVTDQLLAMGRAAGLGDRDKALELSRSIRERHFATASDLLGAGTFTKLHSELEADFDALDELLRGIVAVGEITPRTYDHIASFGPRLSRSLIPDACSARGLNATHVDSRECIVTDATHAKAVPDFEATEKQLAERLKPLLEHRRVPVM